MKKRIVWRIGFVVVTIVMALVYLLPSTPLFNSMPDWWKSTMPSRGITLGLDLQGGMHLVFEVKWDKAVEVTTERLSEGIGRLLKKKEIDAEVVQDGLEIVVKPASEGDTNRIISLIDDTYPTLEKVGLGGLRFRVTDDEAKRIRQNSVDQALETIRNRIDQFGVAEPSIVRQGENEIVIQLPGVKDPKRAIGLIGKTALLEFKLLDEESPLAAELPVSVQPGDEEDLLAKFGPRIPDGDEILFERVVDRQAGTVSKRVYLVKKAALLTGDMLEEARVNIDQRYNEPIVNIRFNDEGAKLFADVTSANVNKRLAIILDNNIYSAPNINEPIVGGSAQISGNFTMEEAKDLGIVLKAGALQAPVEMLQNVTVGPTLGQDSIDAGQRAGIIGVLLVVVFMAVYYKLAGIVADFAMVLNVFLLLGSLAWLNATLTMPGIAGVILAIGMAVDSNVLMFERMREELRVGKTPRAAVDSGYDKAFITIVDSHVTTLITAAVLFQFGTGPIKGFAVTLFLGVAINLFTALVGTKVVFDLIYSRREVSTLSI